MQSQRLFTTLTAAPSKSASANKVFEICEQEVALDATGALYGTTGTGGEGSCSGGIGCGSVFKLTPPSGSGAWTETTLYEFTGGNDGGEALAPLLLRRGGLYGTTYVGGSASGGVLFQLKP